MFQFIARSLLNRRITREDARRKRQFAPWEHIQHVALILDQKDNINKSELDKFIDATRKTVEVFYIELGSATHSFADWRCFSRKDKSLLDLPKGQVEQEVRKKKFDLVIDTARDGLFGQALVLALQAPFKCSSHEHRPVDLVIARSERTPLLQHLNDVMTYLKMIRTS